VISNFLNFTIFVGKKLEKLLQNLRKNVNDKKLPKQLGSKIGKKKLPLKNKI